MKKFTLILNITALCLLCSFLGYGQKHDHSDPTHRCATTIAQEAFFAANPGAKEAFEIQQQAFQQLVQARNGQRVAALNVVIPVAVHVVGVNPNLVTQDQIERQIQLLNIDFAGLNADSTNNNIAWASRRGHSGIQFALAKRDPSGNCTNGITRTVSPVTAFGFGTATLNIKRTALQGKDGWDPNRYFNMWVGPIDASTLGFATFPGSPAADQGVVVAPEFFGEAASSCVPAGPYAKGRTLTHEVGHYLNLFHTFQGGCNGTGDQVAETPAHANPTFGAPTGVLTGSLCAGEPNPPGLMYQNYMDYTDDAAMTMFVNEQVIRMEVCMGLADRIGLQTSNGATPLGANDGAWTRYLGTKNCTPLLGCASATATPIGVFKNNGTASITAAVIEVKVNGVLAQTLNYTNATGLAPNALATINLNPVTITVSPSTVTLEIVSVNGGTDVCTANNTYSQIYTANFSPIVPLPVTQNFETTTLTPGWSVVVVNPGSGTTTWVRTPQGGYAAAGGNSYYYNHFNPNTTNRSVDIRTPRINTAATTLPIKVKFDLAYAYYSGSNDSLIVLASTDCGATFRSIYNNGGLALSTLSSTANFVPNAAAQWRTISIDVPPAIAALDNVIFAFRTRSDWGNNMYIDNINVFSPPARDMAVTTINTPTTVTCNNTVVPNVTVNNPGTEAVSAYTISYTIDGGAPISIPGVGTPLASGASATFNLPVSLPFGSGAHTIVVTTSAPVTASGTGDLNTVNDAQTKTFTLRPIIASPVVNSFETAVNTIANPYPNYFTLTTAPTLLPAFTRRAPGFNSDNSFYIENAVTDRRGSQDAFQLPAMNTQGVDSIYFEFDIAGRAFSATFQDSIIVQYSIDCGNSFRYSTFKAAGAGISGVANSTAGGFVPTTAQWRHQIVRLGGAAILGNGNVLFRFLHKGGWGDNIYIDNINIRKVYNRDLRPIGFGSPNQVVCANSNSASLIVKNEGAETITGFTAAFSVNGGAPVVSTFTGITLASGATGTYSLNNIVVSGIGTYNITAYTYNPISATGTGDQLPVNDTTSMPLFVTGSSSGSLTENFDGATFPPLGWGIANPNLDLTWASSSNGNAGKSALLSNRNYNSFGRIDHLVSPLVSYPATVDTIYLSFDLAAATYNYAGSTGANMDTLEVLYTKDCGATTTSIYKKWGIELQTNSSPNEPLTSEFIPQPSSWRNEKINLSSLASNGPLQFIFRNTTNNGNSIYLDNVNLKTIIVPAKVKTQGYMVTPTVNNGTFEIRHYRAPTSLTSAEVYNAAGQLMWRKNYGTGAAPAIINVDITRFAAGIYSLRLNYTDKKITERIIKQ